MKRTMWQQTLGAVCALTIAGFVIVGQAQQAPAGGQAPAAAGQPPAAGGQGQGRAGGQGRGGGGGQQAPDPLKVVIVGDNPSIAHHAKPGGSALGGSADNPALTYVNFWRVSWTPKGAGSVCFVTINSPAPNAQKFAVTDNPAMAEYIMTEIMTKLIPAFNTPAYNIERGSISSAVDPTAASKTETCKSAAHNVELRWKGLGEPRFSSPVFGAISMSLASVPNTSAEVLLDGKRAPGEYSAGFIAFNETWRVAR